MKMKVILVNFQNEYLSKKGKWFNKSKITKFIQTRFVPFCERHKLPVYEIKSDYAAPNLINKNGCIPGTFGFKSLLPDSKIAGSVFVKSDNSPNFVRIKAGETPVERPEEFKHWLDENIGDPSQIAYVLLLGIGLESSITMVGYEMAQYGYKVKILKEGTDTTNKKYTDFLLDKFPLVKWGSVINFVNFVKELKKYQKIVPVQSDWKPSVYPKVDGEPEIENNDLSQAELPPVFETEKEVKKESEKRPINLMTEDVNAGLSKAETIAYMKSQMKAQYISSEKGEEEPENIMDFNEPEKVEEVAPKKVVQKDDQAEESRRRVEEYYKKMFGEEEETPAPAPVVEPEPVVQPTPVAEPVVQPAPVAEPVVQPTPVVQQVVTPVVQQPIEPLKVEAAPVIKEVKILTPRPVSKEKYAYIFDSMIYIDNKMYAERPKETTPANFLKSNITNGNIGTRKNIKPKTKNVNKISVHERYMLEAEKRRRDNAIKGIKNKASNGKDESLK